MTPLEAIRIAKSDGFDESLQMAVLNNGDPELAYRFAYEVAGADLDALERVVRTASDLRTIYDFAVLKSNHGGDISSLQEQILASQDGGIMILFAMDVARADLDRFEAAVRALPDQKYIHLFEAEKVQRGIE
jgi:hypothetical protein